MVLKIKFTLNHFLSGDKKNSVYLLFCTKKTVSLQRSIKHTFMSTTKNATASSEAVYATNVKLAESSDSQIAAQVVNTLTPEKEQAMEQFPSESPHAEVSASVVPAADALSAALDQEIEKLREKSKELESQPTYSTRKTRVVSMRALAEARRGAVDPPFLWNGMIMEGTLVDIFGRTGVSKSTLVVQILAEYCATHENSIVLLIDMEMSERAQGKRLYDKERELVAPLINQCEDRFKRVTIGRDFGDLPAKLAEIESNIDEFGSELVAIDNLTFLDPELEKGARAQQLMEGLKDMFERINNKHLLTLICLSHTPKVNSGIALDVTQLGGSARIGNAFDEIIGIAESIKHPNMRYIKQCKSRESIKRYTDKCVLEAMVETKDGMLQFVTNGTTSPEWTHLQEPKQVSPEKVIAVQEDYKQTVATMGMKKEACVKEVALKHGISPATVRNYLNRYDENGKLKNKI